MAVLDLTALFVMVPPLARQPPGASANAVLGLVHDVTALLEGIGVVFVKGIGSVQDEG